MLKTITWQQFFICLGGLLAVYYLFLFVKYGLKGEGKTDVKPAVPPFMEGAGNKRIWKVEEEDTKTEKDLGDESGEDSNDNALFQPNEMTEAEEEKAFENLELLASNLQKIISETPANTEKAALLSTLQQEISRYPILNKRAFKVAIGNLVIRQAAQYCKITISQEESDLMWSHF
jgi:hypothetical protein